MTAPALRFALAALLAVLVASALMQTAAQPPEPGEEGAMSLESMMSMGGFILPAKKIVKAMEQAREIAKKQPAEDDEDSDSGDSP